ncbi:hypothetical protein BpHYR1_029050 [Brachionus plicatilis]|uniref:Uncharacterized protein n=1 Tax=Brachionus plicatilis TaxID=10195 RepID=A0A3M7QJY9_BRAPC|nr:hypothetical protein BpHYR1_029050 [Brachionus plicatilis]
MCARACASCDPSYSQIVDRIPRIHTETAFHLATTKINRGYYGRHNNCLERQKDHVAAKKTAWNGKRIMWPPKKLPGTGKIYVAVIMTVTMTLKSSNFQSKGLK